MTFLEILEIPHVLLLLFWWDFQFFEKFGGILKIDFYGGYAGGWGASGILGVGGPHKPDPPAGPNSNTGPGELFNAKFLSIVLC